MQLQHVIAPTSEINQNLNGVKAQKLAAFQLEAAKAGFMKHHIFNVGDVISREGGRASLKLAHGADIGNSRFIRFGNLIFLTATASIDGLVDTDNGMKIFGSLIEGTGQIKSASDMVANQVTLADMPESAIALVNGRMVKYKKETNVVPMCVTKDGKTLYGVRTLADGTTEVAKLRLETLNVLDGWKSGWEMVAKAPKGEMIKALGQIRKNAIGLLVVDAMFEGGKVRFLVIDGTDSVTWREAREDGLALAVVTYENETYLVTEKVAGHDAILDFVPVNRVPNHFQAYVA